MTMTTAARSVPKPSLLTAIVGEREPLTRRRIAEGAAFVVAAVLIVGLLLVGLIYTMPYWGPYLARGG